MSEGPPDRPPPRPARAPEGALPVGEIVERLQLERLRAAAPAAARSRPGRMITGRLEAHGRALYQFRPDGSPSYYVKILSSSGVETLWGVDLERAIKQSKTQPQIGTLIGARRRGSELVTLPARGGARPQSVRRALWIVENVTFFAESLERARRDREAQLADSRALRERPELRSAFVSLPVAEKFAERYIHDPRDREIFLARIKAVMSLSAKNGAPIPASRRRASTTHEPTPRREDPTR